MAGSDSSAFSCWDDIPDDSKFVYEALARLGFSEFSTLPVADMSLVLALALHLKNSQSTAEVWES
jgi:hypothetical protein